MRMYGKREMKTWAARQVSMKVESRDGIVFSIDEDARTCSVKIQNSDELIIARYPVNSGYKPDWLRVGNSVRMIHRSGIRGYIEVTGHGRSQPMGMSGGTSIPTPATPVDGIIDGLAVKELTTPRMAVQVEGGTFRINGNVYYAANSDGYVIMTLTSDIVMGTNPIIMGDTGGVVEIDAAPPTDYFRYDAIVIGADLELDYVKGTFATANPTYPATPADHVLLAYILVVYGATSIGNEDIGLVWTTPYPKVLDVSCSPDELAPILLPTDPPQTSTITVTVKDQYDRPVTAPDDSYSVTCSLEAGDGTIDGGAYATNVFSGSSTTFTYQRVYGDSVYPAIKAELNNYQGDLVGVGLILLDVT